MIDITHDPRAGLEVRRYHTWRVLREQSTGEHSAQIMRIMLTIQPDVSRKLLIHAVFHDVGEMAGDIPYPFKIDNPRLKDEYGRVERGVIERMSEDWGTPRATVLSHDEEKFFKMCEFVEMWEYGLVETRMGNDYGAIIAERCILQASRLAEAMPENVRSAMQRYVSKRVIQENPCHED